VCISCSEVVQYSVPPASLEISLILWNPQFFTAFIITCHLPLLTRLNPIHIVYHPPIYIWVFRSVTCLRVEQPRHPGSIPTRTTYLSVLKSFTLALGHNRRPVQWVPATLSPGTKQPICEAGRSYPGTDFNRGSRTSTLPHVFMIFTGISCI
jgi:hypothetical protein